MLVPRDKRDLYARADSLEELCIRIEDRVAFDKFAVNLFISLYHNPENKREPR